MPVENTIVILENFNYINMNQSLLLFKFAVQSLTTKTIKQLF